MGIYLPAFAFYNQAKKSLFGGPGPGPQKNTGQILLYCKQIFRVYALIPVILPYLCQPLKVHRHGSPGL